MNDKYILDGKKAILEPNLLKWGEWFEKSREQKIVAKTKVGKQEVSTVFLGLDHNFGGGKPLLFETMIFPECIEMERYTTWEEAEKGHEEFVKKLLDK